MKNDVKIYPASNDQPCHWCKAGFVFVADRVNGTSKTTLCEPHSDEFLETFNEPERQILTIAPSSGEVGSST